jgi:NTE family protein
MYRNKYRNGRTSGVEKGNLAQAMIASSAFPSLFSPIEIDGKLLVDGGVINLLRR